MYAAESRRPYFFELCRLFLFLGIWYYFLMMARKVIAPNFEGNGLTTNQNSKVIVSVMFHLLPLVDQRFTVKKTVVLLLSMLCIMLYSIVAYSEISNEDLLSDYDEALCCLEEYNPCIPIIRQRYPNYDVLCEEYRNMVRKNGKTPENLYIILADFFGRIGNPGHLSMLGPEDFDYYESLAEQGYFDGDPELRLLSDKQTRATYAAMTRSVQATDIDFNHFFIPFVSYDSERSLLLICIRSFKAELMDRDQELLINAVSSYPEAKHIVFDIRGNTGGSDYYWMNLLVAPFGETISFYSQIFFKDNALTREYGLMDEAELVFTQGVETIPSFVEELGLTYTVSWTYTIIPPTEENRKIQTDAKRWVLTDETVFSAADGFTGFCKQTHWATIIGKRTKGDGGAVRPFLVRLPKTGLLLRFTAAASANEDGSLNTLFGTSPDIPSKPSESAYDTLLRLIDSENNK